MRRHAILTILSAGGALLAGCNPDIQNPPDHADRVIGGDPAAGRESIVALGCGACHDIPGVRGARGRVGPSLQDFESRLYIAGKLVNRPDVLADWLMDPPAHAPDTAMPNLGIDESEARNIAAYLYSGG